MRTVFASLSFAALLAATACAPTRPAPASTAAPSAAASLLRPVPPPEQVRHPAPGTARQKAGRLGAAAQSMVAAARRASRLSWAISRSTSRCIRAGASRRCCTAATARTKSWWWTSQRPRSSRAPASTRPSMGWSSRRMAGGSFAAAPGMRWFIRLISSRARLTNHRQIRLRDPKLRAVPAGLAVDAAAKRLFVGQRLGQSRDAG